MGFSSHMLKPIGRAIFGIMPAVAFTACCMELLHMLHIRRVSQLRELLSAALDAYVDVYLPRTLTISQIQQRRAQLLAEVDARRLRDDVQFEDPGIAVRIYAYIDTTAVGDRDELLYGFFASEAEDRSLVRFVKLLKNARPWKSRA
ncbi:hypothetical protein V1505DRAFT_382671 [Lipomyces doorenjongii]